MVVYDSLNCTSKSELYSPLEVSWRVFQILAYRYICERVHRDAR